MKTMEMTAVIQYILTSVQSFGSQDYCNKSLMMILENAGVLFYENEQTCTKWIIVFFLRSWVPKEARDRGLRATAGKRVTTLLVLYPYSFLSLSVSFSQSLVFP